MHGFMFQLLKQDVTQQQAVFDKVMQDGHAMLNGTSHGPGRDELKSRLDNSKKRWEEVKQDTDDRSAKIDELHPKSKSFFDSSVTFSCWLMKAETVKASILDANLFADKDMIKQRGLDLQVLNLPIHKIFCHLFRPIIFQHSRRPRAPSQ